MKVEEFNRKIDEWFSQVSGLLQYRDSVITVTGEASQVPLEQEQLLMQTYEELHVASEELRIAQEQLIEQHEKLLRQHQELVQTRQSLEAERWRYQELFEFAPDGYLVTDVSGNIQEANRAAARMLNIELRFMAHKPLILFIPQEEYGNFYFLLSQLPQVEQAKEWEVRLRPRHSTPFDAALTVTPVYDRMGKLISLRWLIRDITERKRMEEQRRLLACSQAAREVAEAQGKRSAFLAEASRLLASCLDYRTTLGRVAQLAVPTLADWCFIDIVGNNLATFTETVVATSTPEEEAWVLKQRERYPLPFDADYGVSKVLQTGEPEVVADISDSFLLDMASDEEHLNFLRQFNAQSYAIVPLTARKRKLGTMTFVSAQPERCYSKADLAMAVELAQRCAIAIDNARLYQEAQDANRMKDEFLAIVSHELRTPLNAVLGWVTMLRKQRLNEATAAKALETIERNAQSQKKLIEDILDVSCIIRGKLHLNIAPVHLVPIINAAIENVRPTAEIKAVEIEPVLDSSVSPIIGDSERLQQIVWNLLTNAIKFTPTRGRVEIRLEQINSMVQIVVKDTGKGITSEFLPHVFERFRQGDATTTRSYGGLGLGLAIVRQLVEMHNGVVYATSEGEGRGAVFTVQLPILESHRTIKT